MQHLMLLCHCVMSLFLLAVAEPVAGLRDYQSCQSVEQLLKGAIPSLVQVVPSDEKDLDTLSGLPLVSGSFPSDCML